MKRLMGMLVIVAVMFVTPVSGQQRGRPNRDNSPQRQPTRNAPSVERSAGRGGNSSHRPVVSNPPRHDVGSPHRGGNDRIVVVHSNPSPRPVVVVRHSAPRYRPFVVVSSSPSWGYDNYGYGYGSASGYVRSEVAEPPETSSCYVPCGVELDELNAMARAIKTGREAKQLSALDDLDQERRELEIKAEGLKMEAENQKLRDELKKLEPKPLTVLAPVKK